jgi:hypothetical protein
MNAPVPFGVMTTALLVAGSTLRIATFCWVVAVSSSMTMDDPCTAPPPVPSALTMPLSVVPDVPLISPPDPLDAAVTRPFASTVMDARVYVPAVTPLFASVAANEPVPEPVTSPVRVIVWSPVFVPDVVPATDAVPVTVSAPLPPFVRVTPETVVPVIAPPVIVTLLDA